MQVQAMTILVSIDETVSIYFMIIGQLSNLIP